MLSEVYENRQMSDSAFHYYKYAMAARDSLFNQEKIQQVQTITFKEELRDNFSIFTDESNGNFTSKRGWNKQNIATK